jgi:hypothetical protein
LPVFLDREKQKVLFQGWMMRLCPRAVLRSAGKNASRNLPLRGTRKIYVAKALGLVSFAEPDPITASQDSRVVA